MVFLLNMQLHHCLLNKVQEILQKLIKHQRFIMGYPQERSIYTIYIHVFDASGAPSRNWVNTDTISQYS